MNKAAVILDRDGVINESRRPVNRPNQFHFYDGVPAAIRRLNEAGFYVCVATNQGGVGLGYLSEDGLGRIHEHMQNMLLTEGAHVDSIKACIHAPDAGCKCRKPEPGMLLQLQEELQFNAPGSFMVGDRETDVDAGIAAGVRTVYIGTEVSKADYTAKDLPDAVDWILSQRVSSLQ